MTMTKSPPSTLGVNVGLCLPRSSLAASTATDGDPGTRLPVRAAHANGAAYRALSTQVKTPFYGTAAHPSRAIEFPGGRIGTEYSTTPKTTHKRHLPQFPESRRQLEQ